MEQKIDYFIEFLKKGNKIHIKDSQKGSFTKYCNGKVTNECIQRGKNSPDPKIRKKATFAANARKWHHKNGGILYAQNGQDTDLINFTKSFETFSPTPYILNKQVLIGYGSANKDLINKGKITEKEAEAAIAKDYDKIDAELTKRIENYKNLSRGIKRALAETAYNIGINKFINESPKLMQMLNSGITDGNILAKEMDHDKSSKGWLGVRSAARRAMAKNLYDWNPKRVDKFGRQLLPDIVVGKEDWTASPYYNERYTILKTPKKTVTYLDIIPEKYRIPIKWKYTQQMEEN